MSRPELPQLINHELGLLFKNPVPALLDHATFRDLSEVEIVGLYPNYATAYAAWKAKAQQTVDNAHMRYFIVHLHRLLDPSQDKKPAR